MSTRSPGLKFIISGVDCSWKATNFGFEATRGSGFAADSVMLDGPLVDSGVDCDARASGELALLSVA